MSNISFPLKYAPLIFLSSCFVYIRYISLRSLDLTLADDRRAERFRAGERGPKTSFFAETEGGSISRWNLILKFQPDVNEITPTISRHLVTSLLLYVTRRERVSRYAQGARAREIDEKNAAENYFPNCFKKQSNLLRLSNK